MIYGKTYSQQFIESEAKKQKHRANQAKWCKVFVWYPVEIIDGREIWLQYAEKRIIYKPGFRHKLRIIEYRLIKKK